MAIRGIERLRQARDRLQRDGDGSPTALLAGASEVWGAMFEMATWPKELREKAVLLQGDLFRYGPIGMTINWMVEPERLQLRREILAFCGCAERFDVMGCVDGMGCDPAASPPVPEVGQSTEFPS